MSSKAPEVRRRWTRHAERALERLVVAVEREAEQNGGDAAKAVQAAVLATAKEKAVTHLAARMQVDQSQLYRCLSGRQPLYELRRRLDLELGLPPGGMERVLSLVEGQPQPPEEEEGSND